MGGKKTCKSSLPWALSHLNSVIEKQGEFVGLIWKGDSEMLETTVCLCMLVSSTKMKS